MHILLLALRLLYIDEHAPTTEQRLVNIKTDAMTADYRADLAGLRRARDQARLLHDDPALGYLAHYWSGYASWRIALNGANHDMTSEDLRANLTSAVNDFETAIKQRDTFADAYAAASSVHGWLGTMLRNDQIAMTDHYTKSRAQLKRAQELEPDNPRVLWVVGGYYLFTPPSVGGDPKRAIQTYQRATNNNQKPSSSSPLPDWGKPEAYMALAYAHANMTPPDTTLAMKEATKALDLAPDWRYVREILIPQITATAKATTQ